MPASPLPSHNGFQSEPGSRHVSPAVSSQDRLGRASRFASLPGRQEQHGQRARTEEHDLIARYCGRLAGGGPGQGGEAGAGDRNSRRLVHELEMKNAEIMREIARLRQNRATVQVRKTLTPSAVYGSPQNVVSAGPGEGGAGGGV